MFCIEYRASAEHHVACANNVLFVSTPTEHHQTDHKVWPIHGKPRAQTPFRGFSAAQLHQKRFVDTGFLEGR